MTELHDLQRFVRAQNAANSYEVAKEEIREGCKCSHWIWYVFPQIVGLGQSQMSREFAISSIEEARAYLRDPLLAGRLHEITTLANEHAPTPARAIFGPDDIKFHSCVTLFSRAAPDDPVFRDALNLFFGGVGDEGTLEILDAQSAAGA